MQKKQKNNFVLEYRSYKLPAAFPAFVLAKGSFKFPPMATDKSYMHFHNCLEIGYCWKGSGILTAEDKDILYEEGDFIILPPYTSHITRIVPNKAHSEVEFFYCNPQLLLQGFSSGLLNRLSLFEHNSYEIPKVISGSEFPEANLFQLILSEMKNCRANYHESVRGLFAAFIIGILRLIPENTDSISNVQKDPSHSQLIFMLSSAIEYINSHYMEQISIQKLADSCFMSLTNFRLIFKQVIGTMPLDYITRVRIQKAQELLFSTETSILNISLKVGFASLSSFNRHFLEIVGTTPLKWRKLCRSISKKEHKYSDFFDGNYPK